MTPSEFAKLHTSAIGGNRQAMYDLALAYREGDGTKNDNEEFFRWMRRAALAGHPYGMQDVAWAYRDGDGIDPDTRLFFEWMKKAAADSGDSEAIFNLALAYKDGIGTDKDNEQFFEWMKKAAEKNHTEAMYHLALAFDEGVGTSQDFTQYFEWTMKIAALGDLGAMLRLAEAYRRGKGTLPSNVEFFNWTKKAVEVAEKAAREEIKRNENADKDIDMASEDIPTAMYNLARAYRDRTGTISRIGLYFRWMKKAAEASEVTIQKRKASKEKFESGQILTIPTIMFELALAFKNGNGTRRSKKQYTSWMKKAAELGLPAAMVELASGYKDIDTSASRRQYCKWIENAATAGDSEGMYRIALAYGTGVGRRHNTEQFLSWINKAVSENHPTAFIAQGIAELQKVGLIGKVFMPFFEKLLDLHSKVQDILKDHILREYDAEASSIAAHYTVIQALHNMLPEKPSYVKANCLRLYNIAYVNDPREGRRFASVDKSTGKPLKNSEHLLEFFPKESEKRPDHPIPWEGQKFSVYVGSFALAKDRLDLWRAYGRDGSGYCIVTPLSGFNQAPDARGINFMQSEVRSERPGAPEETDTGIQPRLYKVYYSQKHAEDTLARLVETLKEVKDERDKIMRDNKGELGASSAGRDPFDSIVRAIVSNILYLYKDDEYENEKEARMLMGFDITAKCLRLESNNEHDPPRVYVETKPFLFESEASEIIIGPKVAEKAAAYLNLQKRLSANNLLKAQVKLSEIKYR